MSQERTTTRDQRGAGTLLILAMAQLALLLSVALVVLGGYAIAAHRARAAADMSAISGAQARLNGGDPCVVARQASQRQGVNVARCETTGDGIDFVVTVHVAAPVGGALRGLPRQVTATAYAGTVEPLGGQRRDPGPPVR